MLRDAATVFVVSDLGASLAYYRDALGFEISFEYGTPSYYACLCRDNVSLHLIASSQTKRQVGQGALCIFVDAVDSLHQQIERKGARITSAPQTYPYGMREFDVQDLDGNQLIYGTAVSP